MKAVNKRESFYSSQEVIEHGVSQVSILGLLLFTIFLCNIFVVLDKTKEV